MCPKYSVAVLLTAYNGEKWLVEQLDSILLQQKVDIHIYISLDHSSDGSLMLCQHYCEQYSNISLLSYGERFGGAGKNFYHLLREVDFSCFDLVAFSDQDDIWFSDKLYRAACKLQEYDVYSSNVVAFWPNGRELLIDKAQPQTKYDYLFEAAGPGCTYVFKREVAQDFKNLILEHESKINSIALHDWLLYAFSRSRGYKWFIDPEPSMRYRQHANNQVGANNSFTAAKKRLILIKNKWYRSESIKTALVLGLDKLPIVEYGLSKGYFGNIYLVFHVCQLRRRLRDRMAFAIVCLFGFF